MQIMQFERKLNVSEQFFDDLSCNSFLRLKPDAYYQEVIYHAIQFCDVILF